ncbi:MAG: DUF370 domain-containing protein [Oscillospiraceae bacterium]|jgi:hypothetical protein|nr:DUF370 domain-containing protein [Oscillospiraceae bacterium]
MYLHLGQDTVVLINDIVGIFDLETSTVSNCSRRFLYDAQKGGRVFNISDEFPKTYIVCVDSAGKETVYISQISSATLRKRAAFNEGNSDLLSYSER